MKLQVRWDLGRAATHLSHHAKQQWLGVLESNLPSSETSESPIEAEAGTVYWV